MSPDNPQPVVPPDDAPSGLAISPGQTVGTYRILRRIGVGPSGPVFKAAALSGRRLVALKLISQSILDERPTLGDRIRGQVSVLRRISAVQANHLVRLFELIEVPQGLLLANEFVDGLSLERLLDKAPEPMDTKQALGIVAATALSLRSLHAQDVLHQNLKPANILLPHSGGLKVADFGLVGAELQSVESVRYMAPELLRGERADGRADLYALGVVAYEMLAGRNRFNQAFRVVLRDRRNQAMRWVKWHTNLRTSAAALADLVPDLSAPVCDLVGRLMEKDPARRLASTDELLGVIRRYMAAGRSAAKASGLEVTEPADPAAPAATAAGRDTAPLPGSKRRLPRILSATLVFWVLLATALALNIAAKHHSSAKARRETAAKALDLASEAYGSGRFADAREDYRRVADAWPAGSKLGDRAHAGAVLAQGRLHMQGRRFPQAAAAFRQAGEFRLFDPDLIRGLIEQADHNARFAEAVEEIERDIGGQNFGEARKVLVHWRIQPLSGPEEAQMRELGKRVEDQQSRARRQQVLDRASDLVAADEPEEAIKVLAAALQSAPNRQLQERHDRLVGDQLYGESIAAARAAEQRGDVADAIKAYRQAYALRKYDQDLGAKLTELQAKVALDKGLRLLVAGDAEAAEAALTRSLGYRESAEARRALDRVMTSNRKAAFALAGAQAAALGDYATAVKQYGNALDFGDDAEVTVALRDAKVRLALQRATEALNAGRFEQSRTLLTAASAIEPDHAQIAAITSQLTVRGEYQQYLIAGDEARALSDFGEAKRNYRRALKVLDGPEAGQRLADTEYDHLIAQARLYLQWQEYIAAKALLYTAAEIRQTDQIETLLAEVGKHVPVGRKVSE